MATFDVSLVTPDGPVFEGEAEMLVVPGADGEIGVLARHAPLVAMLQAGSTRVHVRRRGSQGLSAVLVSVAAINETKKFAHGGRPSPSKRNAKPVAAPGQIAL